MHLYGFIRLSLFLFTWVFSVIYIPFALFCAFYRFYFPVILLAIYYSYRIIFPLKKWPPIKDWMNMNEFPYCNTQSIVFENEAYYCTNCIASSINICDGGKRYKCTKCEKVSEIKEVIPPESNSKTMLTIAPHG